MPNKDRNKRSVRKARAEERAQREAAREASLTSDAPRSEKVVAAKPKAAAKPEKTAKNGKPGVITRFRNYIADVKVEMHRVTWPSKDELRNYSVAVILALVVAGVVLWLVDTGVVALLAGYTRLGA